MSQIYINKSEGNIRGGGSTNRFLENNLKLVYPYLILYNVKFKELFIIYVTMCHFLQFYISSRLPCRTVDLQGVPINM